MNNGPSQKRFCSQILAEMRRNSPNPDTALIKKSIDFCVQKHVSQKRVSGEPYWFHPANAALTLARIGADSETIAAALLHDVLEDTKTTERELEKEFGREITSLVKGVTKLDRISQKGTEQHYVATNIQKIMLASSRDLRVMAIKLADKLHNIQTLSSLSRTQQIQTASQALTIFGPLAHKLGMHELKDQMEDMSFSFINKKKFSQLKKNVRGVQAKKNRQINAMIQILRKKIKKIPIKYGIRNKTVFSVYAKMNQTGKPLEELYDVSVLTMETDSIPNCYKALGELHTVFLPVPFKFKDFIGVPQPNLYQALHTTVMGFHGRPVKVYLATKQMNNFYFRGILALDSSMNKKDASQVKERVKQLNRLFSLPKEFSETEEFMKTLTLESLSKTIFVFTPKGDLIELPYGSTPIDFAFKIHSWLGQRAWRAKVNGQFVGFDKRLENGSIVEIIPSRLIQLRKNWLDLANTISTKRTIGQLIKKKQYQKNRSIDISILAKDRPGMLSEVTSVFEREKINIATTMATAHQKNIVLIQFNIPPLENENLKRLTQRLRTIRDIKKISAERV